MKPSETCLWEVELAFLIIINNDAEKVLKYSCEKNWMDVRVSCCLGAWTQFKRGSADSYCYVILRPYQVQEWCKATFLSKICAPDFQNRPPDLDLTLNLKFKSSKVKIRSSRFSCLRIPGPPHEFQWFPISLPSEPALSWSEPPLCFHESWFLVKVYVVRGGSLFEWTPRVFMISLNSARIQHDSARLSTDSTWFRTFPTTCCVIVFFVKSVMFNIFQRSSMESVFVVDSVIFCKCLPGSW